MRKILGLLIGLTLIISSCIKQHGDFKTISGKPTTKAEIDSFILNQIDSLNIKGLSFALINNGTIVYQNQYGIKDVNTQEPIDSSTTYEAASISKPVFAFFVMKQLEKGLIDLDTPLYQYLPYSDIEYDDRYKSITARMVLSHTSGLCNLRWLEPDFKLNIKYSPGTDFEYSGEGYDYLTKVVAHLNNSNLNNLDSLFQLEIAIPLGLKQFHFQLVDQTRSNLASGHSGDSVVFNKYVDKGVFYGSGSLITDIESYAKFIIGLIDCEILNKSNYNMLFNEHRKLGDEDWQKTLTGYTGWSLGFGMIRSSGGTYYTHMGNNLGYTTGFLFNIESKSGYVYLTNSDQRNDLINNFRNFMTD